MGIHLKVPPTLTGAFADAEHFTGVTRKVYEPRLLSKQFQRGPLPARRNIQWLTHRVATGLTVEQWDDKFFTEYLTENRFAGEMGTNENNIIQVKENLTRSPATASTSRSSTG